MEHGLVELAADERRVRLDDDVVPLAVLDDGLLLAQRMELGQGLVSAPRPGPGRRTPHLDLIDGGGLQARRADFLQVLHAAASGNQGSA